MNNKKYSILYLVLLSSTLVHEIRAKAAANPLLAPGRFKRSVNPPPDCKVCKHRHDTIKLTICANLNFFGAVNVIGRAALVIDITNNMVAVCNGLTGHMVVINHVTNQGCFIKGGGWKHESKPFPTFLRSLPEGHFPSCFERSDAELFELSSASPDICDVVNGPMRHLILGLDLEIPSNRLLGIRISGTFCTQFKHHFDGPLHGLLGVFGTNVTTVKCDLPRLLVTLKACGSVVSKTIGNIPGKGDIINFGTIINGDNGLVILSYLLDRENLDVYDAESLFKLIARLGGNSNFGVNGLCKCLRYIIGFINGTVDIHIMINVIIQFLVCNAYNSGEDISIAWESSLRILHQSAITNVGETKRLSIVISIIQDILNKRFIIGGCNISKIITSLVKGDPVLLKIVVRILLELKIISTSESVSACLLVMMLCLNTHIGMNFLIGLGIHINIKIVISSGGIFGYLLGIVPNVLNLLGGGNLYEGLHQMPGIQGCIDLLSIAVTAASEGKLRLFALLSSSKKGLNLCKGVIEHLGKTSLVVDPYTKAKAVFLTKRCTKFNTYWDVADTDGIQLGGGDS